MWSSMSGAEAIASLLSNPPLAQHLATYARMMAEPDALALLRTVQLGSAPLCNLAQVCPCPGLTAAAVSLPLRMPKPFLGTHLPPMRHALLLDNCFMPCCGICHAAFRD